MRSTRLLTLAGLLTAFLTALLLRTTILSAGTVSPVGQVVVPTIYRTTAFSPAPTTVPVTPPAIDPTIDPALGVIDPSVFAPTTRFPQPVAGALGPVDFPLNVNPLTGLAVPDPAVLNQRPIVTKISNAPPLVRPQSGIGQADIVYEHYAEGGLTRFSAIFHSQTPERVGSVRSARLIDDELTEMYKGLLVFSGASGGVEARLNGAEFAARLYKAVALGQPYAWRDETIEVPHNLFVNLAAIRALAAEQGFGQRPLLRGMAFLAAPPSGDAGSGIKADIRYRATRVIWDYDAAAGVYRRTADGQPHYDATTNTPITAENVVILYVGHYLTDIVESEFQGSVSYSAQITLWPRGNAILLRDGRRYEGTWERAVRPDLLGLRTTDGELLYFKPGNTWFQVVQFPEQMNPAEEWVRVE